ncbi:MAG: peroxiredoxin-like family protein [Planctomycetota bacterium]
MTSPTHNIVLASAAACLTAFMGIGLGPGASSAHAAASEPETAKDEGMKRDKPLSKGEIIPDFMLLNAEGSEITLSKALESGPVVLTFFRGKWCPYCVKALESLETSVSSVNELGATVYAISPQTLENTVDLREQTGLSYELLVDHDNGLAERLGLMFELDPKTVERYRQYGIDLPDANGTDAWELPIPATYVIDSSREVRYAWTNEDYSRRAPVSRILRTLRAIQAEE